MAGTDSGLVDTATGEAIYLYMNGDVVEGRVGGEAGDVAFTVSVDADGKVSLDQVRAIVHPDSPDNYDEPVSPDANTIGLTATITDGDDDVASETIDLSGNLVFEDDGPGEVDTTVNAYVDEDELLPDGNTDDDAATTVDASQSFAAIVDFGADQPGSFSFDLTDADFTDLTSAGTDVAWAVSEDGLTLIGYLAGGDPAIAADQVLTVEITDAETGAFTVTLLAQIDHLPNSPANNDNQTLVLNIASAIVAVDADGDEIALGTDSSVNIVLEDDIPVFVDKTSAVLDPGTDDTFVGDFDYSLGADQYPTYDTVSNFEIALTNFSGFVGTGAITIDGAADPDGNGDGIEFISATADTEVYKIYFSYAPDPLSPQTGENDVHTFATVTFDKADGTYTVVLDEPVQSYSVDSVQGDSSIAFYNSASNPFNGASQWEYATASFAEDFHIAFSSIYDNLGAPGGNGLQNNELFTGSQGYVAISSTAIGVNGNAIQSGEVLDFVFSSVDPGGNVPTSSQLTTASGLYFYLDQYNGEDVVLVLKLADPTTPGSYITRSIIVNADDIYSFGEANLPGAPYPTLSSGQALLIIEPGDYLNLPGVESDFQLVGVQMVTSTNGLAGYGYEFDGNLNSSVVNPQQVNFNTTNNTGTNDNDVIKILDIGVIRQTENTEALSLELDVTVTDYDGDSFDQTLYVNMDEPVPPVVLDLDGDGIELLSMAEGVTFDYGSGLVSTAWVGADDGILSQWTGGAFSATNFVFGGDGMTDLEALAANYDGNSDGVLSGGELDGFGVWVDANSDGAFTAEEFQTLEALNIVEVSLSANDNGYITAAGDAIVYGEGTYTTVDGATHVLADVGFATSTNDQAEQQRQAEYALVAAAVPGLLVASALEATPFFADPQMVNFVPTELTFDRAVASVSRGNSEHGRPVDDSSDKFAQHAAAKAEHHTNLSDDDDAGTPSTHDMPVEAHAVADLGESSEAAATFAPTSAPAGGSDLGGDMMAALMQLGAPDAEPQGNGRGTAALDAVRAALAEVTGKDGISELVEHIVDNKSESAQHGHVGIDALNALLNSGVAGQHFHAPVMADAADDAAHLAAAAAAA